MGDEYEIMGELPNEAPPPPPPAPPPPPPRPPPQPPADPLNALKKPCLNASTAPTPAICSKHGKPTAAKGKKKGGTKATTTGAAQGSTKE
uniref:Uncharacterized protein n=1 Tax=Angiostrongylus cantonensis TaxID=6313 RepID=A0A0K0CW01_ANGCA